MLNKKKVEVELYCLIVDKDESSLEEEEEIGGVIKVIKLFFEIIEEEIVLFFENCKKNGGGEVNKVDYDKFIYIVIVWFKKDEGMIY